LHAEGAVRGHPARDRIMQAYSARRPSGTGAAVARLMAMESIGTQTDLDSTTVPTLLDEARIEAIVLELREAAAHSVVDLGCGEGKLLARLVREKALSRIVGLDVSSRVLDAAAARMKLDRRGGKKSERIELLHGSLFYSDNRWHGFDAAVLADVVQFLGAERLGDVENVVFHEAQLATIVVTLNEAHLGLATCWSINQFDAWAQGVSERYRYRVRLLSLGSSNHTTRMAVFSR